MVEDGLFTVTGMCTKACGSMIRHMAMEFIVIRMEPNMKAAGTRTSNMDMVLRHGPMDQNMRETTF